MDLIINFVRPIIINIVIASESVKNDDVNL